MYKKEYAYLYFWGPWWAFTFTWLVLAKMLDSSIIFDGGWWFNTAGHTIFGAWWILSRCFLIHHPRYTPADFFITRWIVKKTKKHPMLVVFTITILWEISEALYDIYIYQYFPSLGMAQKGLLDTLIDVWVANASALGTLFIIKKEWHTRIPAFHWWGISTKEPA